MNLTKNQKNFTLILIIYIFIFPSFLSISNVNIYQNDTINEVNEKPKDNAVITTYISYSLTPENNHLSFNHRKGDTDIEWNWNAYVMVSTAGETWNVLVSDINHIDNLYYVENATAMSNTGVNKFTENPAVSAVSTPSTIMCFSPKMVYTGYLLQTSGTNIYSHTMVSPPSQACNVYLSQIDGLDSSHCISFESNLFTTELSWHLEPTFSITSDFYNMDNIIFKTYDKTIESWIEQDPNAVILSHPEYKVRIYDKTTLELIFEDSDYEIFKFYREIEIETYKMVNQGNEAIIVSFYDTGENDQKATSAYSLGVETNDYTYTWYNKSGYYRSYGSGGNVNCKIYFANAYTGMYKVAITSYRNAGGEARIYFTDSSYTSQFIISDGSTINFDFSSDRDKIVDYIYFYGTATTAQYIEISSIRFTGEMKETYLNPYSEKLGKRDGSSTSDYNITDLYDNLLEIGELLSSENTITYTSPYYETCQIGIFDQTGKFLNWNNFRVEIDTNDDGDTNDYQLIVDPIFFSPRNNEIFYKIMDPISLANLASGSYNVTSGINNIEIEINTLYITNNANEPINTSLIQNGHYNGQYSFDLEQVHTRPDYLEYSEDGMSYIQNIEDNHNKVIFANSSISNDYGSHPEVENFDNKLTGWTNTDGTGCISSYLTSKTLGSQTFNHVLQQYDNGAGACNVKKTFAGINGISSVNMASSDVSWNSNMVFYESTTNLGSLYFVSDTLRWYNGAENTLQSVVDDTIYHIVLVFNAEDDDVDIYINGIFDSTQNLQNNLITSISSIQFSTKTSHSGFYAYFSNIYIGNSLANAFSSLNSGSYIELDYSEKDYKVAGTIDWGTAENPDLDSVFIETTSIDTSEIVDLKDGHENIHHLSHSTTSTWGRYLFGETRMSGSVEWYFTPKLTNDYMAFGIHDTTTFGANFICKVTFGTDHKIDFEGTVNDGDIMNYEADTRYHLRINFTKNGDCYLYINGNLVSTRTGKNFDSKYFLVYCDADSDIYINAIGFSWNNYEPFSNMIYNNYKSGNSYDWGTVGNEDLSSFTITKGTNDEIYVENLEDHTNVLTFEENDFSDVIQCYDNSLTESTSGSFDFYIYSNNTNSYFGLYFGDSWDNCIFLSINDGTLQFNHAGSYWEEITSLQNDTWYHIHIDYDFSNDWNLFVNGIEYIEDYVYYGTPVNFDFFQIRSSNNEYSKVSLDSLIFNNAWSNIPSVYKNEGYFEFWQKNNINSSALFVGSQDQGSITFHWNNTDLSYSLFNGTYSQSIQNQNQLDNIWKHYKIKWIDNNYSIWKDSVMIHSENIFPLNLDRFLFSIYNNGELWLDALDCNIDNSAYIEGQNQNLNASEDLWCWETFPNWNSGYYGYGENLNDFSITGNVQIIDEFNGHKNVIEIDDDDVNSHSILYNFASTQESDSIEVYLANSVSLSKSIDFYVKSGGTNCIFIRMFSGNFYYVGNAGTEGIGTYNTNELTHIRIDYECGLDGYQGLSADKLNIWINGIKVISNREFYLARTVSTLSRLAFNTETTDSDYKVYVNALTIKSEETLLFPFSNTLENTTISHLPMDLNFSVQVNPYSQVINNYNISHYLVGITDLYDNVLETQSLLNSSEDNEITYTPPNLRTCLISLSDQRSNWLNWQNYRIKINNSLIYEQYFYREIGDIVNISIYDRFDQYITSQVYTVQREDNFITIQLTLHSLKIFNQQELFNFVNITRDPLYYETTEEWTEWLAPNEITEYRLFSGHYKIAITSNENSSNLEYSYYLVSDDILLLTSVNTITNTINSILNVNTTLGNQITNVEINITNQNSNINNSIITVSINLENINSTLGDQLINIDTLITNLNSSVETLFLFTENSLINLNSSLDTLFINVNTNVLSINNTISTLIIDINNDIALLNSSINSQFTQISNDLILMESNLNVSIFNVDTTINEIGNNITENYIMLNNSLNIVNNSINSSQIAILNYLALVNNSIMDSITNVLTQVYLINNSIYTAVINLGTSLSIDNNHVLGNLSVILQFNEELTDLLHEAFFSEFLIWTNATISADYLRDQTEYVEILNEYNNESLEIFFKYQNETESLLVSAQTILSQLIPNQNVSYRVKSIATGEYLDEWKPIPENRTIDLGFYSEPIGVTPEDIQIEMKDYLYLVIFAIVVLVVMGYIVVKKTKDLEDIPTKYKRSSKRQKSYKSSTRNDIGLFISTK